MRRFTILGLMGLVLGVRPPDLAEDLPMRQRFSRVQRKQAQQRFFLGREVHRDAGPDSLLAALLGTHVIRP